MYSTRCVVLRRICGAKPTTVTGRCFGWRVMSTARTPAAAAVSGSLRTVSRQQAVLLLGKPSLAVPWLHKRHYADLPSHRIVTLPALSPTMETGTIAAWEKEEGEGLEEGDILAQIETDKATMDMETPKEGYLAKILLPAGTKDIPLGKPLCVLVDEEGDVDAFKDFQASDKQEVPPSAPTPADPSPPPPHPPSQPQTPPPPPPPATHPPPPSPGVAGRIFASPYAKTVAATEGINLANVEGSGADGRIVSRDVIAAAASPPPTTYAPPPTPPTTYAPTSPTASYTDLELSSMRKTIAKRLQESKQNIPHYYLTVDVDMTKTMALRRELNDTQQIKLSPNDFIVKASALALRQVPEVNSSWMDNFIRRHHNVDISVAVSTDGGLITPIVFGADNKGLRTINQDVIGLAEKARSGKLLPEEFVGGTFTISNLGMYGIKHFTAIINPPQSCILAVGTSEKRLVPSDTGDHKVVDMMTVTMSCDHRVVDGAMGAQWVTSFKNFLEDPTTMLL